jgi:peptide/nickel transport system substrate-binding protein
VKLIPITLAQYGTYLFQTRNWDIELEGNGISLPIQAVPFYSGPEPPKGQNWTGIHNPDYDRLVAKAQNQPLPAACTYWNQAEQALFRDVDVVPIVNRPEQWYLQKAQATYAGYDRPLPSSIRLLR